MKKIILYMALFTGLVSINITYGFFPEYEEEINNRGEQIVQDILKQNVISKDLYLKSAESLLGKGIIKNKEDKNILEEYVVLNSRLPLKGVTKINLNLEDNKIKSTSTLGGNILRGGLSPYNRTAAVNYAQNWALGRNPVFDSYSSDCTNFTSQVLWNGDIGVFQIDTSVTNYQNWWYFTIPTHSWTVAHTFAQHASYNSNRYTFVSSLSNLQLGDIIQFDWTGDGNIDHSTVITQIDSGTTPLINRIKLSYHSNDRLNKPLSEVISGYSNISIYGIHVNG